MSSATAAAWLRISEPRRSPDSAPWSAAPAPTACRSPPPATAHPPRSRCRARRPRPARRRAAREAAGRGSAALAPSGPVQLNTNANFLPSPWTSHHSLHGLLTNRGPAAAIAGCSGGWLPVASASARARASTEPPPSSWTRQPSASFLRRKSGADPGPAAALDQQRSDPAAGELRGQHRPRKTPTDNRDRSPPVRSRNRARRWDWRRRPSGGRSRRASSLPSAPPSA